MTVRAVAQPYAVLHAGRVRELRMVAKFLPAYVTDAIARTSEHFRILGQDRAALPTERNNAGLIHENPLIPHIGPIVILLADESRRIAGSVRDHRDPISAIHQKIQTADSRSINLSNTQVGRHGTLSEISAPSQATLSWSNESDSGSALNPDEAKPSNCKFSVRISSSRSRQYRIQNNFCSL